MYGVVSDNGMKQNVRELIGYIPWIYGIPTAKRDSCFDNLLDPSCFASPFGLRTADASHPDYRKPYPHECLWNGPSWPYATSVALSALARELQSPSAAALPLRASDFAKLLKQYAAQHYLVRDDGVKVPWIDENLHPFTGEWLARHIMIEQDRRGIRKMRYVERGKDYNHSTFCDLVISGVVGVSVKDGDICVEPLAPKDWTYFCLTGVKLLGKEYDIFYDATGEKYGKGIGLRVIETT